ncbi:MAG: TusE/DsrC/DsvC family sulfur relay protein [Candidatus Nanopelagicales bacterium]
MATATIAGSEVQVNEEGFLTEFDEWSEQIGAELAKNIDVEMTDEHWALIRWLREDYQEKGETATTRRVQNAGGVPTKRQFQLFPKKPAKKMAYIAGVPKPKGCV